MFLFVTRMLLFLFHSGPYENETKRFAWSNGSEGTADCRKLTAFVGARILFAFLRKHGGSIIVGESTIKQQLAIFYFHCFKTIFFIL